MSATANEPQMCTPREGEWVGEHEHYEPFISFVIYLVRFPEYGNISNQNTFSSHPRHVSTHASKTFETMRNCICDDSLNFDRKLATNVATEDAVIATALASAAAASAVAVAAVALVSLEFLKCN